MLLVLLIAALAVFLGLGLGLLPAVSRRALGPLRTLAMTAVISVVVLHLLPEALSELGAFGLCVFAAALALPSWLRRLPHRDGGRGYARLGLELGFWGLVVHHIGDGLALGAYSQLDPRTGRPHLDVLLALVLHTVPLVAVVAASYARLRSVREAVARCSLLALASMLGVLGARGVSPALAGAAEAWVAAAVSGLLLHGLTHELARDPPTDTLSRALDLAMAIAGGFLGWLGAKIDQHPELEVGIPVEAMLTATLERCALPLLVGLILGVVISGRPRASAYAELARPDRGGVLSPEAFFVSLVHFGWAFALMRDGLSALLCLFRNDRRQTDDPRRDTRRGENDESTTPEISSETGPLLFRLDRRVDASVAWVLIGALISAVLRAALPDQALAGPFWIGFCVALLFSLTVPLHALLAIQVSFALVDRGLPLSSAVLVAWLSPFAADTRIWRRPWLIAIPLLAAYLLADAFGESLSVPRAFGQAALWLVLALAVSRAYRIGLRAWIGRLLAPSHADHLSELEGEGQSRDRRLPGEQRP